MREFSVIWVGNPFFAPGLKELGWRVAYVRPPVDAVYGWDEIVDAAGFEPDLVVVGDRSTPPFVVGMESFPCLTVLYVVDTHIHSWFPRYAQGFDLCLVSLRDHMARFSGYRLADDAVLWSPPYAHFLAQPSPRDPERPVWPVLFVGTVDAAINPERHAFFDALYPLVPGLTVMRGDYRTLYPQGDIVLNHAISRDLNFRVFEALGCGSCLVTPQVGHGLTDLFRDGEHLFIYDQEDIPALAALLRRLGADPALRAHVAAAGHDVVAAAHYMRHRAETFAGHVSGLAASGKAAAMIADRRANAEKICDAWLRLLYLHHAATAPAEEIKARYLQAAAKGKPEK